MANTQYILRRLRTVKLTKMHGRLNNKFLLSTFNLLTRVQITESSRFHNILSVITHFQINIKTKLSIKGCKKYLVFSFLHNFKEILCQIRVSLHNFKIPILSKIFAKYFQDLFLCKFKTLYAPYH